MAHEPTSPEELLASRRAEFVAFVARRVRDRALAEDLVQSAFVRGIEKLDEVQKDAVAWFYGSLRNAIIDRRRREGAEARALDALASELDDRVEASEIAPGTVCPCVLAVARGLKPEYADALAQIEIDEAELRRFAEERGITRGNAAVRVFRAREALRRGLLATCGACAGRGCVDCTCG